MLYLRINNRCSSSGVCFLHCVFCFVKDSMHIRLAGGGEMEGGCFILCLFAFFNCVTKLLQHYEEHLADGGNKIERDICECRLRCRHKKFPI